MISILEEFSLCYGSGDQTQNILIELHPSPFIFLHFSLRWSLANQDAVLPRTGLERVILLPQSPRVLGLQMHTTRPD